MKENALEYSGIWLRAVAYLIDGAICGLLIWIIGALSGGYRDLAIGLTVIQGAIFYLYTFYFHAKYGHTIGKRLMKLQVLSTDGRPIGFLQSFLRNIPMFIESLLYVIGTCFVISKIPADQFHVLFLHPAEYIQLKSELTPIWFNRAQILPVLFLVAEVIAVILSKKKQALHDMIGATIVVRQIEAIRDRQPNEKPQDALGL